MELKVPIVGVIENMANSKNLFVRNQLEHLNINYLGKINFDKDFEDAIGDVNKLYNTTFTQSLKEIVLNCKFF